MAIRGSWDGAPLFLPPNANFDDGHGVVAEDVHHLDRDLAPPRLAFLKHAGQFQRTVLLGTEGLPLVFEDKVTCPDLFIFVQMHLWWLKSANGYLAKRHFLDPDNFALAFKVEIHRPVVNPVCPALGEPFTTDDADRKSTRL